MGSIGARPLGIKARRTSCDGGAAVSGVLPGGIIPSLIAEALALAAYVASAATHLRSLLVTHDGARTARSYALGGVVVHLLALVLAFASGAPPGFRTSLSATSLGVMVVVVALSGGRLVSLAAVLAPAGAVLLGAAFLAPGATVSALRVTPASWWLPVHLGLVFAAMACFVLEFVAAVFESVVRGRLKRKQLGSLGRLPALDLVVDVQQRALILGLSSLGLGVASGAAWASAELGGGWALSPKVAYTGVVWLYYLLALGLRQRFGWHGRWSIAMSAVGLGALVFSFAGLDFLVGGFHAYGD